MANKTEYMYMNILQISMRGPSRTFGVRRASRRFVIFWIAAIHCRFSIFWIASRVEGYRPYDLLPPPSQNRT